VHVYDDVNADGTRDAGDTNAAGITVELLDGSGNPLGPTAVTDSNGNASFIGLTTAGDGAYAFEVAVELPSGDVVTQTTNIRTPNQFASGGTFSATEGFYAPPR